jgi:hypothetical protein
MRILATLGVTTILSLSSNVNAQQVNGQVVDAGAPIATPS